MSFSNLSYKTGIPVTELQKPAPHCSTRSGSFIQYTVNVDSNLRSIMTICMNSGKKVNASLIMKESDIKFTKWIF